MRIAYSLPADLRRRRRERRCCLRVRAHGPLAALCRVAGESSNIGCAAGGLEWHRRSAEYLSDDVGVAVRAGVRPEPERGEHRLDRLDILPTEDEQTPAQSGSV